MICDGIWTQAIILGTWGKETKRLQCTGDRHVSDEAITAT